jgi:hypothetical protein
VDGGGKIFMLISAYDRNGTCNKMKAALIYKDYDDFFALSALRDVGYCFVYNEELLGKSDVRGTPMSKDRYGL